MSHQQIEPRARSEGGFTLIEMMIVVVIVAVLAAIAAPNILEWLRLYKVRGGTQQVSAEISQARVKAIMGNVNRGVTFAIVDADSYRFVSDDAQEHRPNPPASPPPPPPTPADRDNPYIGPLRELPSGLRFVPVTTGGVASLRYNRLGVACVPGVGSCGTAFPQAFCTDAEAGTTPPRCGDAPAPGTSYIRGPLAADPDLLVTVRESVTGFERTVRISPGGRVESQQ